MKYIIILALVAAVSCKPYQRFSHRFRRGVIHEADDKAGDSIASSGFHHEIHHEHAKSHQSVKLEHFHPVPVYVKKEHSHLLKHPLESGHTDHGVKQVHPKHEHHHGYGLVLEEHNYHHDNEHGLIGHGGHGFSEHSDDLSQIEGYEGGQGELHGWGDGAEQVEYSHLGGEGGSEDSY